MAPRKPDQARTQRPTTSPKKPVTAKNPKLSKTGQDLLSHLERGFQLESEAFDGLVLRNLKDDSVLRTASANQSTIKALEERGLIKATQGRDKLTTVWRAAKKPAK